MNRWRVRWSISPLCCSGVLIGTNRILVLVTASQMASHVGRIVLLPFDVRLDVGGRHQPHGMAKCPPAARVTNGVTRHRASMPTRQGCSFSKNARTTATLRLTGG